ncbi:MAG: hypothetical protein ACPL07_03025, partial [Candidatus Bathyarchaeia archaeon]
GIFLLFLICLMLYTVSNKVSIGTYLVTERYYTDDEKIAAWLGAQPLTGYVVVNADLDNTATWIQALSMYSKFLYKCDFGAMVAPPPYRKVYQDLHDLYANPRNANVTSIIRKYGIEYIIVRSAEKSNFEFNPLFEERFQAGETYVYKTLNP